MSPPPTGIETRIEPKRYQSHDGGRTANRACESALHRLQLLLPELISVGVVGPDGFEIAALSTRPIQIPQLSALTSTLVAIAQAFMLEAGFDPARQTILESPNGSVLLMRVPFGPGDHAATYSLFVISGLNTPLGRILPRARNCAAEIGDALTQIL